jgi:hypothetical protein
MRAEIEARLRGRAHGARHDAAALKAAPRVYLLYELFLDDTSLQLPRYAYPIGLNTFR